MAFEGKKQALETAVESVEFCCAESGQYFRAVAVVEESTGTVVILEPID